MTSYKVAMTGSRNWTDIQFIKDSLISLVERGDSKRYVLIHGGAKGADTICAKAAEELGWKSIVHLPKWDEYGISAGPIRNQLIINERPDILLAFPMPNSRGTYDTIRKAEIYNMKNKHQIEIIVYEKHLSILKKIKPQW
jgi:hypothetical protein